MPPSETVANGNENTMTSTGTDEIPLEQGIKNAMTCLNMFFANKFDESKEYIETMKTDSFYHRGALCYHATAIAIFTMEKPHIDAAVSILKETLEVIDKKRKKNSFAQSITNLFTRTDYNQYTDEEAHAEMGASEFNFMMMCMNAIGDQSLLTMLRCTKRLISSYSSMKTCYNIFKHKKDWPTGDFVKRNFEAGVHMTWGLLNLLISHMPTRILRLASLVSFDGDREAAKKHIYIATDVMTDCLRSRLASFLMCMYEFYLEQFFGLGDTNLEWARKSSSEGLKRFPNGAFDLYWCARYEQIRGHNDKAIELFNRSINAQSQFSALHCVCYWDLLWCNAIEGKWAKAADIACILRDNSKWSPATNAYQYASFLYMIMEEEDRPELRPQIIEAMKSVEGLRTRYAGKTLPLEKFAVVKAARYLAGDDEPAMPALELFYIWNIFGNCKEKREILQPVYERINKKLVTVSGDSYFVVLLLKGVCLRNMLRPLEAIQCFEEIIQSQDSIVVDTYVPANSAVELGVSYLMINDYDQSKKWLERARDEYTGFLAESLAHLRIHGALQKIRLNNKLAREEAGRFIEVSK